MTIIEHRGPQFHDSAVEGPSDPEVQLRDHESLVNIQTREHRDELAKEGVRALLIMNGGGLLALLAFLQTIWGKLESAALIPSVLNGMSWLIGGLLLVGLSSFFRFHSSYALSANQKIWWKWQRAYMGCWYVSLVCFIIGTGTVVYGGWQHATW